MKLFNWLSENHPRVLLWGLFICFVCLVVISQMRLIFLNSTSVPFRVCLQIYNLKPKKGGLCAFDFRGRTFVKYMVGVPGDEIQRVGRVVYVGEARVGEVQKAELLSPMEEGKIPEGYVFVAGTHPDSLDSRYKEFGLISASDIRGRVFGLVTAPNEEIAP
ncbi:MAG: S26 family signal peptidase [Holosporaceae bacterium]|jgi:conjugal transfer pilin signal peptidase TrbI|nr:S26 family signal peptidase [Holosporaceae bacterium]